MYSIGNEVSETAEDKGIELCGKMRDFVKSLDSTRHVTCGVNLLIDVYAQMGVGIYKDKGEYKREPLPDKTKKKREKKNRISVKKMIPNIWHWNLSNNICRLW